VCGARVYGEVVASFFAIHNPSTERRWLFAVSEGYPPAYSQVFHRLPGVIHSTPR
jgi:hypothetical protein